MNKSVKPGDDFFAYANGTSRDTTEIPADHASWGTGAMVYERTTAAVAELVKDAAANAPAGSEARKVGDYYAAFMDEATIEQKGLTPLRPTLDKIAAIKHTETPAFELGETLRADADALNSTNFQTGNMFGVWIAQDLTDPSKYVAFLLQGGLGLPDRDYYLDTSPRARSST